MGIFIFFFVVGVVFIFSFVVLGILGLFFGGRDEWEEYQEYEARRDDYVEAMKAARRKRRKIQNTYIENVDARSVNLFIDSKR